LGNNRGTFYFPYGRKGIVDGNGSRDGSRGGIRVGNASIASMGSGKASVASRKASVASGKASITNGKASIASGKASKELGIPFFLLGTSGHKNDSKDDLKQLLIIEQTNISVTTVLIFPSFEKLQYRILKVLKISYFIADLQLQSQCIVLLTLTYHIVFPEFPFPNSEFSLPFKPNILGVF
jgi:hypothetical protein